jgi:hypothetical protein
LAETGEVIGMGLAFSTPKPSRALFAVASATAINKATTELAAHQVLVTSNIKVEKTFVQPNKRWSGNSLELVGKSSDAPIPAWRVSVRGGTQIHEVWVDAASGAVVGGESAVVSRNPRTGLHRGM